MGHVPHLFLQGPWEGTEIGVPDAQRAHLAKVLRVPDGAPVTYTDGEGNLGEGVVASGRLRRGREHIVARPSNLIVAVGPPASRDRQRFIVEKLAELGIERLLWLETEYGTGRTPREARSRAWAVAALEQSRGGWLMATDSDLHHWEDLENPIVACVPGGSDDLSIARTVAVGPEGGWAPGEVPDGIALMNLGPTILRVETAVITAVVRLA